MLIGPSLLLLTALLVSPPENLAKRYPGKLGWSQSGLSWTSTAEDVWQLKSFELRFGRDFHLSTGPAEVVLGVHEENVLWAVIFPEEDGELSARGQPGDGKGVRTICLRFAPGEIGRVFPSKTVGKNGDGWLRAEAQRIFRYKLGHKWFTPSGNPTVVQPGFTLVDLDTTSGARHFFELDGQNGKVNYVAEFANKPLPVAGSPLTPSQAERAFDEVWAAFDAEYANFESVPKLDWTRHGERLRAGLGRVTTTFELAALLADGLAALEDLHVWVKCGEDWLPGYSRKRPLNASWDGSFFTLDGGRNDTGHDLVWARTEDGIGYLNVHSLSDSDLPTALDTALEELSDTWGMIVDLRFNGGGDETLAQAVAGRFLDEERVYSKNRYRSGPGHGDLGEVKERSAGPRGPWRYEAPVIVLQGQRTMSSAESFALMLAQCPQVTTMGDRTAGSSANPRRLELDCGITVNLPRWQDLTPEGEPIEHVGVEPDVSVDADPEEFTQTTDPVLEAALKRLRKTSKGKREAGKR